MICPRCGVPNPPASAACARCSGSLAPPPERDAPLPSVLPMTRRHELVSGGAARVTAAKAVGGPAGEPVSPSPLPSLYLLAEDRPTGQPPPPGGTQGQPESDSVRTDRPGRLTVGLSGA